MTDDVQKVKFTPSTQKFNFSVSCPIFESAVSKTHDCKPPKGDFIIDNKYVFEIGGKSKTKKQIVDIQNTNPAF